MRSPIVWASACSLIALSAPAFAAEAATDVELATATVSATADAAEEGAVSYRDDDGRGHPSLTGARRCRTGWRRGSCGRRVVGRDEIWIHRLDRG